MGSWVLVSFCLRIVWTRAAELAADTLGLIIEGNRDCIIGEGDSS